MFELICPVGLIRHPQPKDCSGVLGRFSNRVDKGTASEKLFDAGEVFFMELDSPSGCIMSHEGDSYYVPRGEMSCFE